MHNLIKSLTWACSILACGFLLATSTLAFDDKERTPVEHVIRTWSWDRQTLATVSYQPSEQEKLFFKRLSADEVATGSDFDDYNLKGKNKKYVGWYGIVREIEEDKQNAQTTLLVEHKYFDGLTDAQLHAVSFNGSGDFQAELSGTGHQIPPLSLVKVYGVVTENEKGVPQIDAVFVRCWHWGAFTFLDDYGKQRGSEQWRMANRVQLDEIYAPWPHPCQHYYEDRLGKRPDAPQIRQQLIDAAGPLAPDAHKLMNRLVDLLAVGYPWSEAESFRQSHERWEIRKLIETTKSRPAVLDLLIEALHANDERVSSTASELFEFFDPAGSAVRDLTTLLLEHESAAVRARAAQSLASGYGAEAKTAAAALSKFVDASEPDIRLPAIAALRNIGPQAKVALPALRKAFLDGQRDQVILARALLNIEREPNDVVPTLVKCLEQKATSKRDRIVALLGDLGPWAAPGVPALVEALDDKSGLSKTSVIEALGMIGPPAAMAVPKLCDLLRHDEDEYVRSYAAEALGNICDPRAVPVLIAAIEDNDAEVRWEAIYALELLGPQATEALPALVRLIKNGDEYAWAAATAIGAIDSQGSAAPVLIEALSSEDVSLRRSSAIGLGRIRSKAAAAKAALKQNLQDEDLGARVDAAEAYWLVGGESENAVDALRSVLRSSNSWIDDYSAADALAAIGPAAQAAVPDLIKCLRSENGSAVTSAAEALGKIGPGAASAVPALTEQLKKRDDLHVRIAISAALWHIAQSQDTLPLLRDTLQNSNDDQALEAAAKAIGDMGPAAADTGALLRPLLKSLDKFVRNAAATALEQIERK